MAKYIIHAKIIGKCTEKDIVYAIADNLELLGSDMELSEMQKNGKIGKIILAGPKGKIHTMQIETSMDKAETMLIAAAIEQSDNLKINVTNIRNIQSEKRRNILARAKALLKKYSQS